MSKDEKPLVIIVPSYNNENNYLRNLNSIYSQQYSNYRVLYFDDNSTDNTYQLVKDYIGETSKALNRTQLFRSKKNEKQSCHKFVASRMCDDNEIMIFIDGDDWLKHNKVFQIINRVYHIKKPWVTYGNYEIYNGNNKNITYPTFCHSIPQEVIRKNQYRKSMFCTSHLRTCYAWLYKQIPITHLTTPDGMFLPFSTDVAEMRSLIELAGKRHYFINQILYVYNRANSNLYSTSSVKRRNNDDSQVIREHIRDKMKPLKALKKPVKFGINLLTSMEDIVDNLIRNPDRNKLEDITFYYQEGLVNKTDEELEIAVRYMINMGIDLFIFNINQTEKYKKFNYLIHDSYYQTNVNKLIKLVKVDKVEDDDLKGGYLFLKSGIENMNNRFILTI